MKNPPAFPVSHGMALVAGLQNAYGMTMRDYFAAKAMKGICNSRSHSELKGHAIASAKVAYEMADAMLKAREA
jgi:hypothetical protein